MEPKTAFPGLVHMARAPRFLLSLTLGALFSAALPGEVPPLLASAFTQWAAGRQDLAFTQQTTLFFDDGRIKDERIERYDPSLPDSQRWRLLEVDGRPATDAARRVWEFRKNRKPRKKEPKSPSEYVDLAHATLVDETASNARFEIRLRPALARVLGVEKISALITVDKQTGTVVSITATLHQPVRVLLGLARITDLDVDVRIEPGEEDAAPQAGEVESGSTARVAISKLGSPAQYKWSDFKRVISSARSL